MSINGTNKPRQPEATQTQPEESTNHTKQKYHVDFKKLASLIYTDLEANNGVSNVLFSTFSKADVAKALQSPHNNEKFLRDLSKFLYVVSTHYKRLCDYYGDMSVFRWYISPLDFDKSKVNTNMMTTSYNKHLSYLTNMNLSHEMGKITSILFREGIYYGYKYESTDSFFLQKLDPDYCRITGVEDGVYTFGFNFQYFDNPLTNINNYAPEFKEKYDEYKDFKKRLKEDKSIQRSDMPKLQWRELSSANSICIKGDETIPYTFPPFVGVVPDIYEIQEYKNLKKASAKLNNTALLVGTVPINKQSEIADDFLVDLDTAVTFGNKMAEQLPDQMAFLLSVYEKVDLLKMPTDTNSVDKVEEAVKNFWSASGTQEGLFTGSASTDASQDRAIATDEQIIFRIMRQQERWVNRTIKLNDSFSKVYKFKFQFMNITNLNWKKVVEQELKVGQYGIPNKIRLCTAIGMLQSEVSDMAFLENELLKLPDVFKPLISSNTMSVDGTGEAGNPSAKEDGSVPTNE